MTASTVVWVLETGVYEQREVVGVYFTPEDAMADWPHGQWNHQLLGDDTEQWKNDQDWWKAARITRYEVEGTPKETSS